MENILRADHLTARAPWDGWADDLIQPGQYKDFYYPNKANARTLWYHVRGINPIGPGWLLTAI